MLLRLYLFVLGLAAFVVPLTGSACSMSKITINGHTYVGNNEDSWRRNARVWFENGKAGSLGCVYVGYDDLPQGGMNEAGLAFDGLTVAPKPTPTMPGKKEIANAAAFLKSMLSSCRTVADVQRFVAPCNWQKAFPTGMYLFADRSGSYLVMEPDTMYTGSDDKYLISNFCPSVTSTEEKLRFDRYSKGMDFLARHAADTGAGFCLALTDTMHDCRRRIGDGTLYSYVADLDAGNFTLCFFHDFKHPHTFNLKAELAKGNHAWQLPDLFPGNKEYQGFLAYKTPHNNAWMLLLLFLGGGLFGFSALFFMASYFGARRAHVADSAVLHPRLWLAGTSAVLLYFMTVLYRTEAIYYYPAPFRDFHFSILNVAAYIPFALLLLMAPLIRMNLRVLRAPSWSAFSKGLFLLHNLFCLLLLCLFGYWGFYSIF